MTQAYHQCFDEKKERKNHHEELPEFLEHATPTISFSSKDSINGDFTLNFFDNLSFLLKHPPPLFPRRRLSLFLSFLRNKMGNREMSWDRGFFLRKRDLLKAPSPSFKCSRVHEKRSYGKREEGTSGKVAAIFFFSPLPLSTHLLTNLKKKENREGEGGGPTTCSEEEKKREQKG